MAFVSLDSVLNRMQSQEKWAQERLWRKIFRHWQEAVGELVAPHTRPTGLHRRILQVAVSSPVWAQTLAWQRRSILQKLNQLLAEDTIVDIHFSTARWEPVNSNPQPVPPAAARKMPTTPQEAVDRCRALAQVRKQLCPCPHCGAPASRFELERWRMCQHCVVRYFFTDRS
ncbi:MAG: DUF721 domain-containing protein [Pseudanabaenaceae cyanobacterium SKYGB_i_bin29]|nr:DUF721 domain-containing protein [Pseudanabaenaceae cyanobacterium SKYG29]MDW8420296.1 DUF721 domain-containing protein [Pseudanabaenaceae cyanobacterium SKYGB_i_bin29]